ncbi:MAG: pyrroline-5-carboxylate reductase [Clostridia bacterium]|nr:pyrroline-5-carboxylate reductase [Clostridia bacterium]
MTTRQQKVGFIGAGIMAEVIIKGILQKEVFNPAQIWIHDIDIDRTRKLQQELLVNITADNNILVETVDLVVVSVKPQAAEQVLCHINPTLWEGKLLASIAAGINTTNLASWTSQKIPIARIMPNTPCMVGAGMSAICFNEKATEEEKQIITEIFASVGEVCTLHESLMNAATGVSGSGPAYVYLIIEALSDGGVKAGLPRPVSLQLAVQTLLGAATMVKTTGKHPGELKDMVTSPGGTTIEALASLERDGVRAALIKAVEIATKKAEFLGRN